MENLHLKNLTKEQILKHPYFKKFSKEQLEEIKIGMQNNINFWAYAKYELTSLNMSLLREHLEKKKYGEIKTASSKFRTLEETLEKTINHYILKEKNGKFTLEKFENW